MEMHGHVGAGVQGAGTTYQSELPVVSTVQDARTDAPISPSRLTHSPSHPLHRHLPQDQEQQGTDPSDDKHHSNEENKTYQGP